MPASYCLLSLPSESELSRIVFANFLPVVGYIKKLKIFNEAANATVRLLGCSLARTTKKK